MGRGTSGTLRVNCPASQRNNDHKLLWEGEYYWHYHRWSPGEKQEETGSDTGVLSGAVESFYAGRCEGEVFPALWKAREKGRTQKNRRTFRDVRTGAWFSWSYDFSALCWLKQRLIKLITASRKAEVGLRRDAWVLEFEASMENIWRNNLKNKTPQNSINKRTSTTRQERKVNLSHHAHTQTTTKQQPTLCSIPGLQVPWPAVKCVRNQTQKGGWWGFEFFTHHLPRKDEFYSWVIFWGLSLWKHVTLCVFSCSFLQGGDCVSPSQ